MDAPIQAVALAGAGPVAQALGRVLTARGWTVEAVASRSLEHATAAARFIGGTARGRSYEDLGSLGIPVIIAVTDAAIPEVAGSVASRARAASIALHTCGAAEPAALQPLADRGWSCGVLHPLQTIPSREQGVLGLPGATFAVGGDAPAAALAGRLAATMAGRVLHVQVDSFPLYHAAAVLAGNGMFALVAAAVELMTASGIDRRQALAALAPLCESSLTHALSGDAARLTGPVARGDAGTLRAHLTALPRVAPESQALYVAVARRLVQVARGKGLTGPSAAALERVIDSN